MMKLISSFSKGGVEIVQACDGCCMPEFCASIVLAFILGACLSLGSSFLHSVVISERFKIRGKIMFVKASLMHFICFEKQKSIFLRHVFHNFFNSSHRNSFKGEFSVYSKLALYFKDTVIIIIIIIIIMMMIIIKLIIIPCTH